VGDGEMGRNVWREEGDENKKSILISAFFLETLKNSKEVASGQTLRIFLLSVHIDKRRLSWYSLGIP